MISKEMVTYVQSSSLIRAMFEEGKRLSSIYGPDKVYDFSLGNPNLEAPKEVKEAIIDILSNEADTLVHGYMNNSGYEVIVFAPYFGEYRSYTANYHGKLVVVSPNCADFQPNLKEFEDKITQNTKAVIINSPNNPTGVIYSEDTIIKLTEILRVKQQEYGTDIYLISDEPYRELAYDGADVPYLTKYYENTIVGYSYSKSLSLPGERIGYLVIPNEVDDFENVISAANVANRILGFVNAPSLFQRVIGKCIDVETNVEFYDKNRKLLYEGLTKIGYECIKPEGAFYLFVKSPIEDDVKFCNAAKKHNILIVPGTSFACPG